jgi:hypothetical protein
MGTATSNASPSGIKKKRLYKVKLYVKLLSIVAMVVCAYFVGAGVAYNKTSKHADKYVSETLIPLSAASDLKVRISLLESINTADYNKAKRLLEALVDNDLATIAIYVNNQPAQQEDSIVEAIKCAKKYREQHPEHKVIPNLANSVKKTLDYVKDK